MLSCPSLSGLQACALKSVPCCSAVLDEGLDGDVERALFVCSRGLHHRGNISCSMLASLFDSVAAGDMLLTWFARSVIFILFLFVFQI